MVKSVKAAPDCRGHQVDEHTVQQGKDHRALPHHAQPQTGPPANQQSKNHIGKIQKYLAGAIAHTNPLRHQRAERLGGIVGEVAVFGNGKAQTDQPHSTQEAEHLLEIPLGSKVLERCKAIAEKVQQDTVRQNGKQLEAALPLEFAPQHEKLEQEKRPFLMQSLTHFTIRPAAA